MPTFYSRSFATSSKNAFPEQNLKSNLALLKKKNLNLHHRYSMQDHRNLFCSTARVQISKLMETNYYFCYPLLLLKLLIIEIRPFLPPYFSEPYLPYALTSLDI